MNITITKTPVFNPRQVIINVESQSELDVFLTLASFTEISDELEYFLIEQGYPSDQVYSLVDFTKTLHEKIKGTFK
jgi:hypothetical protein